MALPLDEVLTGWLVFLRLQGDAFPVSMPALVRVALVGKGWITTESDPLGEVFDYEMTEEGAKVADLNAGDWGIDAIPAA